MTYRSWSEAAYAQFEDYRTGKMPETPPGCQGFFHKYDFGKALVELKSAACHPSELYRKPPAHKTLFYDPHLDRLYLYGTVSWSARIDWHFYVWNASQAGFPVLVFHREVYLGTLPPAEPVADA